MGGTFLKFLAVLYSRAMGKGSKPKGQGKGNVAALLAAVAKTMKGGRKGGGKGFRRNIGLVRQTAKTKAEKCVWIGGLKERDTYKDAELNKKLQEWINKKVEGCKF